ncbi:MAG TPA: 2-oxoglutarate dehydrogenase E1 component, partial [Steroidobacteraceae bacterium]|nr:2-oxoglutarate dehydrogenase E1 component [Steroidobacteraceae bacterium]
MLEPTPLYGGNADFLDALYEQYLRDPASVDERWRAYFAQLGGAGATERAHGPVRDAIVARAATARAAAAAPAPAQASADVRQAAVSRLIRIWINRGHLVATIDPLALTPRPRPRALEPGHYGLTPADLDQEFFTGSHIEAVPKRMKLRDILAQLQYIYGGNIGAEFAHVSNSEERIWLQDEFQEGRLRGRFSPEERRNILWQLTAAEGLERYLHTKYVGQKRFSLEGGETLLPLLDDLIQSSGGAKIEEVVIGMAHRGRLNVLVTLLGKSPATLFSEF